MSVYSNIEIQDLQSAASCDNDIIQGMAEGTRVGISVGVGHKSVQHHAVLDLITADKNPAQSLFPVLYLYFGQVADIPDVDAEDGRSGVGGKVGRLEHGSVTSKHQQAVQISPEFAPHILTLHFRKSDLAGFSF